MNSAVIGAGAIGNLVAGYLAQCGHQVQVVGRAESISAIKEQGLRITGIRGQIHVPLVISDSLESEPDLVILATKTQDTQDALLKHRHAIARSIIVTTQNGVRADDIAAQFIPPENIITSVVMFGSTYVEPAHVVHNFEGSWIIGSMAGITIPRIEEVKTFLECAFPVVVTDNIRGMKYLKLFVNVNNCIPAILGMSMQEAFVSEAVSRISVAIWREGIQIMQKVGITLESLPGFPVERVTSLVRMPLAQAAQVFSQIMSGLSAEPVYGSILQSIRRGRLSEIDYINGEFVACAQSVSARAPLNELLVSMVHDVERTGVFKSPKELIAATLPLIS